MTCDSHRPCSRCVQRGLQDTCEDAPRKRKKYLDDVPMDVLRSSLGQSESPPPATNQMSSGSLVPVISNSPTNTGANPSPITLPPLSQTQSNQDSRAQIYQPLIELERRNTAPYIKQEAPLDSNDLMKKRSKFMSSAADLEYSTLSNIVSDNFFNPSTSNEHTPNSIISPTLSPMNQQSMNQVVTSPNTAINDAFILNEGQPYHNGANNTTNTSNPLNIPQRPITKSVYDDKTLKCDDSINQYYLGSDNNDYSKLISLPDITEQIEMLKDTDPSTYYERNSKLAVSVTIGIIPDDSPFTRISDPVNDIKHYFKEPEEIYEKVNRPYSYTPGYHSLIAYLRKRFNKEMLVKMAETMASYRPSFIACTNSLKEHDLIFMEQCFQRTLLTYDSIIRVSGTPTIVWRRTGEIAYVGNEFCALTGWSKEELLNVDKKLIVELLDDKSVLEYFQLFLRIAFGDFFGATMTECTLLAKKHNTKIKTRCSFTLKRDVFGIPMMIIGNFLPVL